MLMATACQMRATDVEARQLVGPLSARWAALETRWTLTRIACAPAYSIQHTVLPLRTIAPAFTMLIKRIPMVTALAMWVPQRHRCLPRPCLSMLRSNRRKHSLCTRHGVLVIALTFCCALCGPRTCRPATTAQRRRTTVSWMAIATVSAMYVPSQACCSRVRVCCIVVSFSLVHRSSLRC
jgi:hypothetical protein